MSPAPFASPEWLAPALAALCAAALALAAGGLLARRRARRLLGPGGARALRGAGSDALVLAALAALALALLGPRIGERRVAVIHSGVDVVLLVDVSLSMDARDAPPSRLDRARRTAEQILLALAPGDRAALAVYAGMGVLLTPLTPDTAALAEMLPALDTGLMRPRGSHLGDGVRAALEAFDVESERPRVVVVLSDGEEPAGGSDLGAREAARAGARVVAAAFGSDEGTTVPDHGVPHRDAAGRIVVSHRDTERLGRLSRSTGGALYAADAWGAIDLAGAMAAIRREAGGAPGEPGERRVAAVRVVPFAALAFALLALEAGPLAGLRRLLARGRARRDAALLAVAGLGLGQLGAGVADVPLEVLRLESAAGAHPDDARRLLELGYARARDDLLDDAARALESAAIYARMPGDAALAFYDLGVVALARRDLEAARDAFLDALALAPDDTEARYNLEWTLRELAREPPHPPPDPEPGSDGSQARGAGGADAGDARGDAGDATPTDASGARSAQWEPLELKPEDVERWLGRLQDDPSRALRGAARKAASRARRQPPDAPTW